MMTDALKESSAEIERLEAEIAEFKRTEPLKLAEMKQYKNALMKIAEYTRSTTGYCFTLHKIAEEALGIQKC